MGMYTELYLSCSLKGNIPKNVVKILDYWFNDIDLPEDCELPDHPLFNCGRWFMIGRSSSCYFTPFALSKLYRAEYLDDALYLTTRFDLKNYGGEIEHFLDFIMPYIDGMEGDHLGHKRYENDDEPTLIYY